MSRNPFRDHLATIISDQDFDEALNSRRRLRKTGVPDWLYDYEDEEIQHANRCYVEQSDKDLINIRDFFAGIRLSPPFCDRLPGVPVWALTPFYKHVIVWLDPCRSEASFAKLYGLGSEAFADLCGAGCGDGRIMPILNAPPSSFHGLAHFERILRLRPPTFWRDFFFQRALAGAGQFVETRREAQDLIRGSISGRKGFASLRVGSRGSARDLAISCFCQISAFGGRDLARRVVKESKTPRAAADRLFFYSLALYDSFVSPLGGTYPCTTDQIAALAASALGSPEKQMEIFPIEVGKSLIQRLPMPMPQILCNRGWWTTEASDIWRPAREALASLDQAVAQPGNVDDASRNLEDTWRRIGRELSRSRSLRGKMHWIASGIGVAGLVGGSLLPPVPGLIASVLATAATLSIFDIPGTYARLTRPRHLVALLDLRDYLDEHPLVACPSA